MDVADYVLSTLRPEERPAIEGAIAQAAEMILQFLHLELTVGTPDAPGRRRRA
jgi:peptidyl-tRNA hydrolase